MITASNFSPASTVNRFFAKPVITDQANKLIFEKNKTILRNHFLFFVFVLQRTRLHKQITSFAYQVGTKYSLANRARTIKSGRSVGIIHTKIETYTRRYVILSARYALRAVCRACSAA